MSSFIHTSVGKKLFVSITGLFLIIFIGLHLTVNLFLFGGEETYNLAVDFMDNNPVIGIMEPVLAAGFLLHIIYTIHVTFINQGRRNIKYNKADRRNSSWPSRNMFVLGGLISVFLILHLSNFWYNIKFGGVGYVEHDGKMVMDAWSLVTSKFTIWWYALFYVAGAVFLGLHLLHGFQSAFLSLGLYNSRWRTRLELTGTIYSVVVASGFATIPIYFFFTGL